MLKLSDSVGLISAVAFSPDDRGIVAGGPAARRRYLDVALALSSPGYLPQLSALRHALGQRNAALRHGRPAEARTFDTPFAHAAARVARARRTWAATWRPRYYALCKALGEQGEPDLRYRPDHQRESDAPEDLRHTLAQRIHRDAQRGMTTTGPHRDDLLLTLNGKELRTYGSAGQQRTAAIALRLLEAETLSQARGVPPIALYDDVFAELDAGRQAKLLELIHQALPGQAIVTAPRASEVPAALLALPRWHVHGGQLAQ